jgi:hypothetical protein
VRKHITERQRETLTILSVEVLIILVTKFINTHNLPPYIVDLGLPESTKQKHIRAAEYKDRCCNPILSYDIFLKDSYVLQKPKHIGSYVQGGRQLSKTRFHHQHICPNSS